jgi:hypothetical protein
MTFIKQLSSEKLAQLSGAYILLVVVFIPVWNAFELMFDPNLQFWLGKHLAWWWLFSSLGLVLLYLVTTQMFFQFAKPEWRNDGMVTYMGRTFISALAIGLILQSYPVHEKSLTSSRNLLDQCTFNTASSALQAEYKKLRELRETGLSKDGKTECAALNSVKECKGFVANDYTSFLEYAEQEFSCSGLCVLPEKLSLTMPHTTATPDASADPYTTVSPTFEPVKSMESPGAVTMVSKGRKFFAAKNRQLRQDSGAAPVLAANVGNALFSTFTYEYYCAHMIASDLRNRGSAISDSTFMQGIVLLFMVMAQSFAELLAEVRKQDIGPGVKRIVSAGDM